MIRPHELRVLIVDDEPLARDFLRRIVEGSGASVVAECGDGEEAVVAIRETHPDVVLLDVRMPEVDGFDVIERVGTAHMPEVVFVTAHEQHALRAFEVHALDYVVKPCAPDRVLAALTHVRRRIGVGDPGGLQERLEALVLEMEGRAAGAVPVPRKLAVREGEGLRFVDLEAVHWLEADGNGVRVHTVSAIYDVRTSLATLVEHLAPARFARIHRSAAVNLAHVAGVQPWGHGDHIATLTTGRRLRVSRTYREALLKLVH